MAQEQLKLVNDSLLISEMNIPLGPSSLYLVTAEMISYYAGLDIRGSLFANSYSCQMRELSYLHQDLVNFNQHRQSEYAKKEMISRVSYNIEDILNSLSRNSCY